MLSFFPRGVLDENLNLIESVPEGFPSYSYSFLQHPVTEHYDRSNLILYGIYIVLQANRFFNGV